MGKVKARPEKAGAVPRIFGIAGVGEGVGATHFSVMFVNYLAGYRRRRAALLEWNGSGDLEQMERVCTGMSRDRKPFRVLEADYFKKAGSGELSAALAGDYEDILIDFGNAVSCGLLQRVAAGEVPGI